MTGGTQERAIDNLLSDGMPVRFYVEYHQVAEVVVVFRLFEVARGSDRGIGWLLLAEDALRDDVIPGHEAFSAAVGTLATLVVPAHGYLQYPLGKILDKASKQMYYLSTMIEQQPFRNEEAPYYTHDEQIGEVKLWDRDWMLRMRAHVGDEEYARHKGEEIIELTQRRGTRPYALAKSYILPPDYRVTVQMHQEPGSNGHNRPIGKVVDADWPGMRRQTIGTAQAWYYPFERTVVLGECFLESRYAKEKPQDDPNQQALWRGFEGFLQGQFPQAHTMVTTHAEPMVPTSRLSGVPWPARLSAGQPAGLWQSTPMILRCETFFPFWYGLGRILRWRKGRI